MRWLVYILGRTSTVGCEVEAWYMWELLPKQLLTNGDSSYYLIALFSAIDVLKNADSIRRLGALENCTLVCLLCLVFFSRVIAFTFKQRFESGRGVSGPFLLQFFRIRTWISEFFFHCTAFSRRKKKVQAHQLVQTTFVNRFLPPPMHLCELQYLMN